MPRFLDAEATLVSRLARRAAPVAQPLSTAARQNSHPATDENVIAQAITNVADGGGTSTYYVAGGMSWRESVTITNTGTSYVTLINASQARRVLIDYCCAQDGNTQWGTLDLVLLDGGSAVELRHKDKSRPAADAWVGVTFAGSISMGGDLLLTVHGDGTGTGSITFKATCRTVAA